jgi:glycosyltransferase involved in cell wall biosynthesis
VIASIDPATGGPVAGLQAITPCLQALGHSTEFATLDASNADFLQAAPGPVHAFGPVRSSYGYSPRFKSWLRQNASHYDAIFVHGLWQYLGIAVRSVCRSARRPPYFVVPHGMLDPFLQGTYPVKHFKKSIYWRFVERRVVEGARAVFFTCEEERRLSCLSFPRRHGNDRVMLYGTTAPTGNPASWQHAWQTHAPALRGHRPLLFLSRLHSKKGIDLLLRAYGKIRRESSDAARATLPELVVAGPSAGTSYVSFLRKLAETEGIDEHVHWVGMLTGEAKWGALRAADVFALPSHQENFGIAVVEALACGTPVLISNRVNIWREIVSDGAGWADAADVEGIVRLLRQWLSLTPSDREKARAAASRCFTQRFEITAAAQSLAEQLEMLLKASRNLT